MSTPLSDHQKAVLFKKVTERPFSGSLVYEKRLGVYSCANCGTELFSSDAKFDSGSGWPSFTSPKEDIAITLRNDESHGMIRTEASCTTCGGHLGHVFADGPLDQGGRRFCINSLSLAFEPKYGDDDSQS